MVRKLWIVRQAGGPTYWLTSFPIANAVQVDVSSEFIEEMENAIESWTTVQATLSAAFDEAQGKARGCSGEPNGNGA